MKKRSLNSQEKALLLHCLKKHAPSLVSEFDLLDRGLVDAEKVNKMREAIGDELVAEGLNADDEPNEVGLKLEDLIGRLADLYLWPKELEK